jgi:hypothetical protein
MENAEKPNTNIPLCPKCGAPLTNVTEVFSSINEYKFVNNRYKVVAKPTEIFVVACKNCKAKVENKDLDKIVDLFPKL